jgi:hypothetical protein
MLGDVFIMRILAPNYFIRGKRIPPKQIMAEKPGINSWFNSRHLLFAAMG